MLLLLLFRLELPFSLPFVVVRLFIGVVVESLGIFPVILQLLVRELLSWVFLL